VSGRAAVLTFRGVRGSAPVSGPATDRYGGRTLCIDIDVDPGRRYIIDGGTGLMALNGDLEVSDDGLEFHCFLTHYHWDHIQGLLFFPPIFDARNRFILYGHSWDGWTVRRTLEEALRPPWFPISIADTPAAKEYVDVQEGPFDVGSLRVLPAALHHPQGVTAYRFDHGERSVVIATDYERGDPDSDAALARLAEGAGILIHDAQYTPDEYPDHYLGWGHSTRHHAVEAAREAGVERLILVSHDPARSDDEIDAIVEMARDEFPATEAAFEGMTIRF